MNEQTEKLIRELAEKLGTTVDHLWGVLVRQAPIDGCASIISWLFIAALIAGMFFFVRYGFRRAETCVGGGWAIASVMMAFVAAILAIALVVIVCTDLSTTIAAFKNPEYWALKQLIK